MFYENLEKLQENDTTINLSKYHDFCNNLTKDDDLKIVIQKNKRVYFSVMNKNHTAIIKIFLGVSTNAPGVFGVNIEDVMNLTFSKYSKIYVNHSENMLYLNGPNHLEYIPLKRIRSSNDILRKSQFGSSIFIADYKLKFLTQFLEYKATLKIKDSELEVGLYYGNYPKKRKHYSAIINISSIDEIIKTSEYFTNFSIKLLDEVLSRLNFNNDIDYLRISWGQDSLIFIEYENYEVCIAPIIPY